MENNLIKIADKKIIIAQAREKLVEKYLRECYPDKKSNSEKKKRQFVAKYNLKKWPYLFQQLQEVSYKTLERWKKRYLDAGKDFNVLIPGGNNTEKVLNEVLIQIHLETDKTLLPDIQKEAIMMIKAGRIKIYFLNSN